MEVTAGEVEHVRSAVEFNDFFRANYPTVLGVVAALTGRRHLAEELTQDAFMKALSHWERIARYDDPAGWVRRVAVNMAVSSFRRRRREVLALARWWNRADRTVELGATDREFWQAVRSLPPRQAQCVALRYLEDRTSEDIGQILGITPATVRAHLYQARQALATGLGESSEDET